RDRAAWPRPRAIPGRPGSARGPAGGGGKRSPARRPRRRLRSRACDTRRRARSGGALATRRQTPCPRAPSASSSLTLLDGAAVRDVTPGGGGLGPIGAAIPSGRLLSRRRRVALFAVIGDHTHELFGPADPVHRRP